MPKDKTPLPVIEKDGIFYETIGGEIPDVGRKHLEGWRVFTDGGSVGSSISKIGGASAWIVLPPGYISLPAGTDNMWVQEFTPDNVESQNFTSNNAELLAIVRGVKCAILQMVESCSSEDTLTICSDSKVAIGWFTGGFQRSLVPRSILAELYRSENAVAVRGIKIECCILAGHPDKNKPNRDKRVKPLEQGYKIKEGKTGRLVAYPVSRYNHLCDQACTAKMKEVFGEQK